MIISFDSSDINFYFSFQCPYSYLTWVKLCNNLKDVDNVKVKPINIGLNPPNKNFSYMECWGGERWLRLSNEAKQLGIIINKPLEIVSEEHTARSVESYGPANAEYYISTIFKAVFSNNLNIAITPTLRYFLQSEGNDSEVLVNACNDPNTLKTYNENIELWTKKRIRTLPTIEFSNERLAGFITNIQIEYVLRSITDKL